MIMHMCLRFKFDLLTPIPLDKTKSDERTSFWNITLAYSILRKSPKYNTLYWKLGGDPFAKRQASIGEYIDSSQAYFKPRRDR